jgi:hypothetical protein
MSATKIDEVPPHDRNDGTGSGQWNPLASTAGNRDADRPAITAAPGRRTPHSTTAASHPRPTPVV